MWVWIQIFIACPNYKHARKPLDIETPEDVTAWAAILVQGTYGNFGNHSIQAYPAIKKKKGRNYSKSTGGVHSFAFVFSAASILSCRASSSLAP